MAKEHTHKTMGEVTELDKWRRDMPIRLQRAREKLLDTLDSLRAGTLTTKEADAIREAIEEELRALLSDAGF
jgi:hypothetical protein